METPISGLELQDLAIDCGGGDVELFGGAADRSDTGDLIEIAQNDRVHGGGELGDAEKAAPITNFRASQQCPTSTIQ